MISNATARRLAVHVNLNADVNAIADGSVIRVDTLGKPVNIDYLYRVMGMVGYTFGHAVQDGLLVLVPTKV